MCDCNGCKFQYFCKLDPDLNLKDAIMCGERKNAEVFEVPKSYIIQSYNQFTKK